MAYIRYFFYLAYNWNIRIAWHIVRNEIRGERKYGIETTGADELQSLADKGIDTDHATIYMPASYDVLEDIFSRFSPTAYEHFVDIGCGKGRVLCVAAQSGGKKLTGIDFSKEFCQAAINNLESTKENFPGFRYSILNNDAFYFSIPDDADCLFLFNPFDDIIMSAVIENIEISLEKAPRKISIIYANPLLKHLFMDAGYKTVYHTKKMKYLEAVVLQKSPA